MKKFLTVLTAILLVIGIAVQASDLIIESKNQTYNEADNKIKFNGDVKVKIDDLKVVGDSADVNVINGEKLDTATFYDKPYAFEIKKNKKREVKANILKVSLITKIVRAEGDTQSVVFDGKTPVVVINANVQEYNTKTGVMTAEGAVTMLYKDIETFSNSAEITTDKNGDLKKLVLIGGARVKQENNETFADKFVYDAATGNVTAYGNTTSNAIMDNGQKMVLKSAYQEYNQKRSVYNASGNVRIWYQDYYAAGPKVSLYPDKTSNGKPNEAYFVGRSSITQGVRTIYADRIKMTMKPKSFDAQGNTRTVIKNIGSGSDDTMTLGL
jgi:lipopolysaccharide export system protein LptA